MKNVVRRLFVEKKKGFDVEAQHLCRNIKENLGIENLECIRVINRYDVAGISDEEFQRSKGTIFSEPNVDKIYDEDIEITSDERVLAIEFLPGQYDQRADSAAECVQILTQKEKPLVNVAKLMILKGNINDEDFEKIKGYCINPVDSREALLKKPESLEMQSEVPEDVKILDGFIDRDRDEIASFREAFGFAMNIDDLVCCRDYFRNTEKRNPTITELKAIDTYWSDHCRHTTFLTEIEEAEIEKGLYGDVIEEAFNEYLESRKYVYGDKDRDICLMDIAVMGMKELRKKGELEDLEVSDEVNACSIEVDVDVDGENEKWLVMFKNETHNHPTEIEPFGGAATCLGGAIRDPLSGRAYVYQAMRVTGSGDPRAKIEDTLPGKLPQRKITTEAAHGYSSYGNQIGLATGQVAEVYDEGFLAKRMEIGAVIAAAPKENVKREAPVEGDLILLVGGRTGRDGCGGATGSSKEHTEESIFTCGAEVQKGNPPTERKIQRLFRNSELAKLIKKCNDFGAGGVSVAIGELADSLEIDLDKVPKKYEGLDGTELAISESQERMAVVIDKDDLNRFIELSREENLESTLVAKVTNTGRLTMKWRGKNIFDISRDFLNTNGVKQKANAKVVQPLQKDNYFDETADMYENEKLKDAWIDNLKDLNVAGQKGLVERFDSTIGAGTVLMPFGGKYSLTPTEGMVAKIPVVNRETNTCTIMTYGYNPRLAKWSPFHGAMYSVIESISKVVALGGDYKKIRLTLQEYFEKLGDNKERWGKPFSALLGAFYVQKKLKIPAIGGKDSMSGTFKDLKVPPTLVSFAVDTADARKIVSPEFKKINSHIVYVSLKKDSKDVPDFDELDKNYSRIYELIQNDKVLAAAAVRIGGLAAVISKMSFGNKIGVNFTEDMKADKLFRADYGSIILEIDEREDLENLFDGIEYSVLGRTQNKKSIDIGETGIELEDAIKAWTQPLVEIFPTKEDIAGAPENILYEKGTKVKASAKIARPRVFIPVFPGTNCEYDTARAFERSGGIVDTFVLKNLTPAYIEESIAEMAKKIGDSQIIALPGGFSAGDEPDGSGKFIATVFRNPLVKEAVMNLIKNRDGLVLGICNGFQALIKLGLLPYGEIRDIDESCPTLTYNKIGRHVSCMPITKVVSNLSPWLSNVKVGDIHRIAMSHGEGRFVANDDVMKELINNGQVATQYVNYSGNPSYNGEFNPNGSLNAIEGITSPDGRIFGKMGHSERIGRDICKNVPGHKDQKLFEAGISYFG
ncbi:phosphoribosylformylglycinamidine synthase [Wukongibacter sp. M2B1]|uniref:phosphoribosylformylglycinamidine synthase n=1 Tax=Wukongibacter sp. M2B1 TaxID=3088895 RepID=UPI003D7B9997